VVAALPTSAAPPVPPAIGMLCSTAPNGSANNVTINLETAQGYILTPDGNSILIWSYAPTGGSFQYPGPVLCVDEGDTVTVNLTNTLAEPASIVFPGQSGVTASGDSTGLFTAEAAASGGSASYTFIATQPGTYLYESGTTPHKQIEMGLFGALIVRPALGAQYAYNDATTQFDANREYLMVLHEIDPELHLAVEDGRPYDWNTRHDRYWTINGRSFPDVIADNNVPWLPGQPYGALVQVEASAALPALIRYANAGSENHPFHPHGNHLRVIARDGRLLGAGGSRSMEAFTKTIGSGQSYDLLFRWTNVEGWTSTGNPLPVNIPGLENLVFKDGLTFYSGSPYLGETGDFPAGTTVLNECGEFYFPWHSHALNEFQNFDEGFGGMSTLLRVDRPGGCS
jgi:FtsP/CotA-like multicopper oxidase with cupredoxin domain